MELLATSTALIIALAFVFVFVTKYEPEIIFGAAFVLLLLIRALPVEKAFLGLSNSGVITLICLFVVAGAVRTTGALNSLITFLLQPSQSQVNLKAKLLPAVAGLSAFFNNTPIVASLTPGIVDWYKRYNQSPSKILLPISYAAILGGTCTIIGTSTNLIIKGLLEQEFPSVSLGFFEIAWIGVPITLIGIVFLIVFSDKILPKRELASQDFENIREYTFELQIDANGPLAGKTVEQAGLRGLNGVFLIEVMRENVAIGNIAPNFTLQANDLLIFSGSVSAINDLSQIDGLIYSEQQLYKLDSTINTSLLEVIVTASNSLVGQTVKQSNFRKRNQAVIVAVIRGGNRLNKKTGDIQFKAGDILLLQATPAFIQRNKFSRDFLILQSSEQPSFNRSHLRPIAWISLLSIIFLAAFNIVHIVVAALISVLVVIATKCITMTEVRRSIDFKVIALIVFAFGFGEAIQHTGLGDSLANVLQDFVNYGPFSLLVATYLLTLLLTEMVTNNAAAVISFSLIANLIQEIDLNIIPYAIAIMIAASASFITPLGYQTNLIVYSAGNYNFSDYLRLGLPLSIVVMLTTLLLIPMIWPLTL